MKGFLVMLMGVFLIIGGSKLNEVGQNELGWSMVVMSGIAFSLSYNLNNK